MKEVLIDYTPVRKVSAYEVGFDQSLFAKLRLTDHDFINYRQKKEKAEELVFANIKTFLGERLNVLLSKNFYPIEGGRIRSCFSDEPFLAVIKRGRDYRRKNGNPSDFAREDAEIVGFEKVEQIMCQEDTPLGTMILSISPRGGKDSVYKHNFYDIFCLIEKDGKRGVEARRYSSALSQEEYVEKLAQIIPSCPKPLKADDVYFLSNPVLVPSQFKTPDELHRFLHREHDCLNEEDFSCVIQMLDPFIRTYIKRLRENPFDERSLGMILNSMLNIADEAEKRIKTGDFERFYRSYRGIKYREAELKEEISFWGAKPVEAKFVGCGYSSSFSTFAPFRVADFAEDQYGSLEFECPNCRRKNRRPTGKLLDHCQHCGANVAC